MDISNLTREQIDALVMRLLDVSCLTHGRDQIFTPVTEITDDNVVDVLNKAVGTFNHNASESTALYDYYRGIQPIIFRNKTQRPEIMNVVLENRAYEIVTFKTGRFLYKDIVYTNRSEDNLSEVDLLNRMMYAEDKAGKDRKLVNWFHIAGNAYRLVVDSTDEGAPFHIYSLDPRRAFVVYADTVEETPMLGVYKTVYEDLKGIKRTRYTAYTKNKVYQIEDNKILDTPKEHFLGDVPLVEYPANLARLGSFEVVISLLNAINNAQSNRLDGVEQFIQALLVFKGLNLTNGDLSALRREGAIMLPKDADMDYLTNELNQDQTQTLVDDLYQAVLTICGMPNRNGKSSTSDNKGAVVLRDGWSAAATAVKDTKQYFSSSERRMLKMVLTAFNIYRDLQDPQRKPLTLSDIDIHFDEGEYENMQEKSQVFATLLGTGRVHPRDAFTFSNITNDPEAAYVNGQKFYEKTSKEEISELNDV